MLTERTTSTTSWVLWKGSFLHYSTGCVTDLSERSQDYWACTRTEQLGMDPTVRPGKAEYLRLRRADSLTREMIAMTTNQRLFWTPPMNAENEELAIILNALSEAEDPYVTPEDASLRMAHYMEHCEFLAEKNKLQLTRCPIPASTMLAMLDGVFTPARIQRCLQIYQQHFSQ